MWFMAMLYKYWIVFFCMSQFTNIGSSLSSYDDDSLIVNIFSSYELWMLSIQNSSVYYVENLNVQILTFLIQYPNLIICD